MLAEIQGGPRKLADGAAGGFRGTRHGGAVVADGHARYYDCVKQGRVFSAALPAAVALGTALTATAVTLTLYNPVGSTKDLVILEGTLAVPVATTAGQVVWAINDIAGQAAPASVTALAAGIHNCYLGAGLASVAAAYSAATLAAAPKVARVMAGIISTTPGGVHQIVDDVNGRIILPPGSYVTIQGITTNATGQMGIIWEEADV